MTNFLPSLRSPALGAVGLVAGERIGAWISPRIPITGTTVLGKLVVPAAVMAIAHFVGRHGPNLRSMARGVHIGAIVHAVRNFTTFDTDLSTW